jgi:hypothetical protein
MNFARVSTWILVGGTSMLFIIGFVSFAKYLGAKNIPVISTLSTGVYNAWKAAA